MQVFYYICSHTGHERDLLEWAQRLRATTDQDHVYNLKTTFSQTVARLRAPSMRSLPVAYTMLRGVTVLVMVVQCYIFKSSPPYLKELLCPAPTAFRRSSPAGL